MKFLVDGSEFYANKRDKDGEADHAFENYCKEKGIKHLLCITKTLPE